MRITIRFTGEESKAIERAAGLLDVQVWTNLSRGTRWQRFDGTLKHWRKDVDGILDEMLVEVER